MNVIILILYMMDYYKIKSTIYIPTKSIYALY